MKTPLYVLLMSQEAATAFARHNSVSEALQDSQFLLTDRDYLEIDGDEPLSRFSHWHSFVFISKADFYLITEISQYDQMIEVIKEINEYLGI